jgi:hypothetical protein
VQNNTGLVTFNTNNLVAKRKKTIILGRRKTINICIAVYMGYTRETLARTD